MAAHISDLVRARLNAHLDALPTRPTQRSIGDAIGRTQTWVSHYLSGRHDCDLDTLAALAAFLNLDLSALVGPSGERLRTRLDPPLDELVMLFQSVPPDEREVILQLLRSLTRPIHQRRAR